MINLDKSHTGWPDPREIDKQNWNSFCDRYGMETACIAEGTLKHSEKVSRDPLYSYNPEIVARIMKGPIE